MRPADCQNVAETGAKAQVSTTGLTLAASYSKAGEWRGAWFKTHLLCVLSVSDSCCLIFASLLHSSHLCSGTQW